MSALSIPSFAAAALPAVNVHPHGHGHKQDVQTDPLTDSSSSTAAQIPVGTASNLFGNILSSLEQVIGLQPASLAGNLLSAASTPAASAAAGSKVNVMA